MRLLVPVKFVATAMLLAGCGQHTPGVATYTDDGVRWGQPVDGLKVGISRRTYVPGREPGRDQLYFSVQILNVSDRAVSILAPVPMGGTIPEDRSGDESVRVKLTYDSAAGLKTAQFTPPNKPVVQRMEPGKEYRMELRLSPSKFGLDRFVAGRMSAGYSNSQDTIRYQSTGDESVKGLWTGDVTSGAVALDDTPLATRRASLASGGEQGGTGGGAPR